MVRRADSAKRVAVGNVHILTSGSAPLDFEALGEIERAVSVPLVLHGGTGISLSDAKRCVRLGVTKVNCGTGLKQAYLAALRVKADWLVQKEMEFSVLAQHELWVFPFLATRPQSDNVISIQLTVHPQKLSSRTALQTLD